MHAASQSVPSRASSDVQLTRAVAAGDLGAFENLMRRHNQALFRAARAILRNDADAEEAVQDGYLMAYRALGTFKGDSKLSTWLMRIVINEALARRRKNERRAAVVPIRSGDIEEHEYEAEAGMREGDGPEDLAGRKEIRRLLEQKIDALPDIFRAVFVLRALEELSVEDTAAALGIPEATVRTRFYRARSQLREALSREVDLAFGDAFVFLGERCDRIVQRVIAKLIGA